MNPKHEWFKLSKTPTIVLFLYYLLLLGASLIVVVDEIYSRTLISPLSLKDILPTTIKSSVLGATIFYMRKLYKACINLDIQSPTTNEDKTRQIGVFFYFFLRPIFSCAFSVISILILKSGISILSDSKTLSNEFYYLSTIVSFFIGFSCGDLIDKFEELGKKVISKVSDINI